MEVKERGGKKRGRDEKEIKQMGGDGRRRSGV